jgi:hypothetical protein
MLAEGVLPEEPIEVRSVDPSDAGGGAEIAARPSEQALKIVALEFQQAPEACFLEGKAAQIELWDARAGWRGFSRHGWDKTNTP